MKNLIIVLFLVLLAGCKSNKYILLTPEEEEMFKKDGFTTDEKGEMHAPEKKKK